MSQDQVIIEQKIILILKDFIILQNSSKADELIVIEILNHYLIFLLVKDSRTGKVKFQVQENMILKKTIS